MPIILALANHVQKYHLRYIFGLLAALTCVSIVLRFITPASTSKPTPSPSPQMVPTGSLNSFLGLRPGLKVSEADLRARGQLLGKVASDSVTTYSLKSVYISKPNKVTIDSQSTILFAEENVLGHKTGDNLQNYIAEYGQPDLVLFNPSISLSVRSNVFLNAGIVVTAHVADGSVEQKWFFPPTDKDNFTKLYGEYLPENLDDSPEGLNDGPE